MELLEKRETRRQGTELKCGTNRAGAISELEARHARPPPPPPFIVPFQWPSFRYLYLSLRCSVHTVYIHTDIHVRAYSQQILGMFKADSDLAFSIDETNTYCFHLTRLFREQTDLYQHAFIDPGHHTCNNLGQFM